MNQKCTHGACGQQTSGEKSHSSVAQKAQKVRGIVPVKVILDVFKEAESTRHLRINWDVSALPTALRGHWAQLRH